jgi:hypothetical protein
MVMHHHCSVKSLLRVEFPQCQATISGCQSGSSFMVKIYTEVPQELKNIKTVMPSQYFLTVVHGKCHQMSHVVRCSNLSNGLSFDVGTTVTI